MEITEDDFIEKYGKNCRNCNRNTLLPCEYEFTFLCGYNVIKRKHELSKIQRKKINFKNRLKYAEPKISCMYVDVYKFHEVNDTNKIYEVLSILKNKKLVSS